MSEWREVTLGDLCDRLTVGHVGKMADEYVDDGIEFLRSQNIKPFRIEREGVLRISPTFDSRLRKSRLSTGDVVVVRTGYPGTAAVVPMELDGSNCADLVVITPSKELNPHLLAAIFNSAWGRSAVSGQLVGSAQQHFNVGSARAMRVMLPDRAEQNRLADVLCSFNDLIENNRRRIEVLELMAQAIYRDWFVRFRYPGHEDATFVDSSLGPIPDGWTHQPFSKLADFLNGYAFKPAHLGASGRPIVKIRELKLGVVGDTPRCLASEVDRKFWIDPGDLLFSWSADLGVYRWSFEPALLNQHLFAVLPQNELSKAFLFHALDNEMSQFWDRAQGTTMRHIKRAALTEVATVVPPRDVVRSFTSVVEPIHQESIALRFQRVELAVIRDMLLPKLVSGQIDVSTPDLDALLQPAS